jgi:hypothetical protein
MKRLSFLTICLYLCIPFKTFGQFENIIIPSDLKQQTIITEPPTLRKGFLRAGIAANFIMIDRVFDEDGKKEYLLSTNTYDKCWSYVTLIQYGITERLQAYVSIPFVYEQRYISIKTITPSENSDTTYSFKSTGRGFGDLEAGLKYQIIRESESFPSVVLGLYPTLPTGRKNPENIKSDLEYDLPTGRGNVWISSELIIEKIQYPYSFTVKAQYIYNFKGKKVMFPYEDAVEFKRGNTLEIAAGFGLHLNDWIALVNDFTFWNSSGNTYYDSSMEVSPGSWWFAYWPAVYFQIRKFRFFEVIQIPLMGKYIGADPTYSFNLQYVF